MSPRDRRRVQRRHERHLALATAAAILIVAGLYVLSTFAAWYVTVGAAVWLAVAGFAWALCALAARGDRIAEECRGGCQERQARLAVRPHGNVDRRDA